MGGPLEGAVISVTGNFDRQVPPSPSPHLLPVSRQVAHSPSPHLLTQHRKGWER